MNAQSAASGSSASTGLEAPPRAARRGVDVTMSNQASQTSIAPVAAASGTSSGEPRNAARAVTAKRDCERDVEADPGEVVVVG